MSNLAFISSSTCSWASDNVSSMEPELALRSWSSRSIIAFLSSNCFLMSVSFSISSLVFSSSSAACLISSSCLAMLSSGFTRVYILHHDQLRRANQARMLRWTRSRATLKRRFWLKKPHSYHHLMCYIQFTLKKIIGSEKVFWTLLFSDIMQI